MSVERDKYLTEAMGEFFDSNGFKFSCPNCYRDMTHNTDFSTWEGFGKLWEWAIDQEWFSKFIYSLEGKTYQHEIRVDRRIINPDRFATAVYEFLKDSSDE